MSWSRENRSQLIRIPAADGEYARFELRSPDPQCNPYHAFALLMEAGLEGVREGLPLPEPLNLNLYAAPAALLAQCEKLPGDLGEAVEKAASSAFVSRRCLRRRWRNWSVCGRRNGGTVRPLPTGMVSSGGIRLTGCKIGADCSLEG